MADNIVPFPRRRANDDGVPPFDPTNPAHVRVWQTIYLLGQSELRAKLEGDRPWTR